MSWVLHVRCWERFTFSCLGTGESQQFNFFQPLVTSFFQPFWIRDFHATVESKFFKISKFQISKSPMPAANPPKHTHSRLGLKSPTAVTVEEPALGNENVRQILNLGTLSPTTPAAGMLAYPFGRPLAALCCWLSLLGGVDKRGCTPHVLPINSVGCHVMTDYAVWESGLKTTPHTTYNRLLQEARTKGGQVLDTYNMPSWGESGRVVDTGERGGVPNMRRNVTTP